ncbi:MAG: inner membrane CreD family protein [Steroidobacteraceae bacterium]
MPFGQNRELSAGAPLHLVPDDVRIATDVAVEIRSKGIYAFPVYVAKVVMTGEFKADAIAGLLATAADTRVLPARAVLQLPVRVAAQSCHPVSSKSHPPSPFPAGEPLHNYCNPLPN